MKITTLAISLILLMAGAAGAATYYMNASATGANNGGAGNDAWQSFSSMSAAVHALGDHGAGDTVIVSPGNYGVWDGGVLDDDRDAYLNFEAVSAVDPNISQLILKSSDYDDPAYTPYLKFTGFTFDPGYSDTDADTIYLYSAQYVQFYDCHFESLKLLNPTFGDFYPYLGSTVNQNGRSVFSAYNSGLTKHITISNCTFENTGNCTIYFCGSDSLIEDCSFQRCKSDHIKMAGRNDIDPNLTGDNIIRGCTITDVKCHYGGMTWPGTSTPNEGAWTAIPQGEGRLATFYNAIGVAQASGIFGDFVTLYSIRWVRFYADDDTLIPTTTMQGTWKLDSDPNNIYFTTSGASSTHGADGIELLYSGYDHPSITERCWFYDILGQNIKVDGGHQILRNNVFIGNANTNALLLGKEYPFPVFEMYENIITNQGSLDGGIRITSGVELHLHNNIISGASAKAGAVVDANSNIWLQTGSLVPAVFKGSDGHDQYGVTTTSLFVNYAMWDFNTVIVPASPGINAGDASYTDTTDYTGVANVRTANAPPDIGAYEYVPTGGDNHAPVFDANGPHLVSENRSLTFDVNASDEDSDPLTYGCSNLPVGATFITKTFSWTPTYRQAGIYNLMFSVTDGIDPNFMNVLVTVTNVPTYLIMR